MSAFHDVLFPTDLALGSRGGPLFRTEIVQLASGRELRNSRWSGARRRWDVGTAIGDLGQLQRLITFFEARRGALHGFRFRDPFDRSSAPPGQAPQATDSLLGLGDGQRTSYPLVKGTGAGQRRILTPVAGSVRLAVDGVPVQTGWHVEDGQIHFLAPPAPTAQIRAGFLFDVPVRFDQDQIEGLVEAFGAGRVVSLGLLELLEIDS